MCFIKVLQKGKTREQRHFLHFGTKNWLSNNMYQKELYPENLQPHCHNLKFAKHFLGKSLLATYDIYHREKMSTY